MADGWNKLGVRKGEHIFTHLSDDWEQIEVRLAAYEIGAILTSFNKAHTTEQIINFARTVPLCVFISDPQISRHTGEMLARELPEVRLLNTGEDHSYENLIDTSLPEYSSNPLTPTDPASLGFTSGTTGPPKGLFVNQGVGLTSLRLTVANIRITSSQPEMFLLGIPLVGAGSGVVLPLIVSGSTLLIPPEYSMEEMLPLIQQYQVTRTFITPSILIDLLDYPDLDRRNLNSLRNVIYGTAPMPAAKLEEAIRRFGPIFQQGYGMAEILPPVSLLQMEDHKRNSKPAPRRILNSVGRVVPQVQVIIVDENELPAKNGEIGEVIIKSPTVFSGYWKRPDLTQRALKDCWMHTRDMGFFDQEGLLHILDRRQDLIRRSGHVVYPRQVEEVIHDHPAIKEACLVSSGPEADAVMCVSLRRDKQERGQTSTLAEELLKYLAERIKSWQMPDRIQFFDELPRSFLGKVIRREVREALSQ